MLIFKNIYIKKILCIKSYSIFLIISILYWMNFSILRCIIIIIFLSFCFCLHLYFIAIKYTLVY